MRASDKIGGLPGLTRIWDRSPIQAALTVLMADVGIMWLLMLLEGLPPWQRVQYVTVVWNDVLFYPLYAAMTVVVLRDAEWPRGFNRSRAWHFNVLVAGFAVSLVMEINGIRHGEFTINQEMSPAKLWHTIIAAPMFYWLVAPLPMLVTVRRPRWAIVVITACCIGATIAMWVEITSPWPPNAHLVGSYIPWVWHIRR